MRILCKLGVHDWVESSQIVKINPIRHKLPYNGEILRSVKVRLCKHCMKKQKWESSGNGNFCWFEYNLYTTSEKRELQLKKLIGDSKI